MFKHVPHDPLYLLCRSVWAGGMMEPLHEWESEHLFSQTAQDGCRPKSCQKRGFQRETVRDTSYVENSEFPQQESNLGPTAHRSDAQPLSYRRLVGA